MDLDMTSTDASAVSLAGFTPASPKAMGTGLGRIISLTKKFEES